MPHPSISTKRLVLTPYEMRDVNELHRVMSDPRVMLHIGKGALSRLEVLDIVTRVVASWNETGMGWWTIRLKEDGYLIGQICLRPEKDLGEIAVGYALDVAFWRKGYAREALQAVVAYGFKEKSLRRIAAIVRAENADSRALLERCGFIREPDVVIGPKTRCLYATTLEGRVRPAAAAPRRR
ncbi:MAG: GNAT family N-acetyltransferase [Reyranella sp.]|nr:GNAT family N-acetyltransferase [Reyranella sp.]